MARPLDSAAMANWRRVARKVRRLVRGGATSIPRSSVAIYRRGHPKQELKAFDIGANNRNFIVAGTFVLLNPIVQGNDIFNRIGRKVYMKSVRIRGVVINIATSTPDTGRIFVVYDAQPNGAQPVIADILQESNAGATTSNKSNPNLNNRHRFKILRDHLIYLPACTNTAGVLTNGPQNNDTAHSSYSIDWFIPLKGLESLYNAGNAGTIADFNSGSLYLVVVSQVNDNLYAFSTSSRYRYYD